MHLPYHRDVLLLHADHGKFICFVYTAYEVLSDPGTRVKYDFLLTRQRYEWDEREYEWQLDLWERKLPPDYSRMRDVRKQRWCNI